MTYPPRRTGSESVLAVDIGGTKMAVGLVDATGELWWTARAATPEGGSAEQVWQVVETLVRAGLREHRPVACGIGCGGPMEPGGALVSPLHIPGWKGFPLRQRMEEVTGLATWVDNDAKVLALGEGWKGSAAGLSDYMSMVVSTGVGAGLVMDGKLLDGRTGNAGHIGHVVVEPEGRDCECGGRGCLEAEASGRAIAAVTGRPAEWAGADVAERTGRMVGRAVASVANLLDLCHVSVAGSVALGFGQPFFAAAQAEIRSRSRLPFSAGCRIVPSSLGERCHLVGAAALAWRRCCGE